MLGVLILERLVAVPVADAFAAGLIGAVEKLDEAHAFLDQPPGQDAVAGVSGLRSWTGLPPSSAPYSFRICAGSLERSATSGTDELHAGGQFVAGDPRGQFGVARETFADDGG